MWGMDGGTSGECKRGGTQTGGQRTISKRGNWKRKPVSHIMRRSMYPLDVGRRLSQARGATPDVATELRSAHRANATWSDICMRETGGRQKVAMHESVPKVSLNCPDGSKSCSKVSFKGAQCCIALNEENRKSASTFWLGTAAARARPSRRRETPRGPTLLSCPDNARCSAA